MRAREFVMKDAYSFHLDAASLQKTYDDMHGAYTQIFTRLGLKFRSVMAASGEIGGSFSQEFHVLAETGEDEIYYEENSDYAYNVEVAERMKATNADHKLIKARGIEVGHIFQLGDKYSQAMNALVTTEDGKQIPMQMGCYGIGVSRILGAAIEQNHDEQGIIWPTAMAPFQIALVPINYHRSEKVKAAADKLYQELIQAGFDVLLDDRDERPGAMFADMELIGIPYRLVVSEKGLAANTIEYKGRRDKESQQISAQEIINFLKQHLIHILHLIHGLYLYFKVVLIEALGIGAGYEDHVHTQLVGFGYALWTIATQSHVTNSSVLLIILAVIVFLVGLVSEQISAMRFESRQ
jgi:prolyl-tRNA synthetase